MSRRIDIEYKGEKRCITEWSRKLEGCRGLVSMRINRGHSIMKAISTPKITPKLYTLDGLSLSLSKWAKFSPHSVSRLRQRLRMGWSFEDSIYTPPNWKRVSQRSLTKES